jgi:hypothetical protein
VKGKLLESTGEIHINTGAQTKDKQTNNEVIIIIIIIIIIV